MQIETYRYSLRSSLLQFKVADYKTYATAYTTMASVRICPLTGSQHKSPPLSCDDQRDRKSSQWRYQFFLWSWSSRGAHSSRLRPHLPSARLRTSMRLERFCRPHRPERPDCNFLTRTYDNHHRRLPPQATYRNHGRAVGSPWHPRGPLWLGYIPRYLAREVRSELRIAARGCNATEY